jgi:hypothetical protein
MCFAVWEDGQIELKSCPYAVDTTVEKVQALPIESALRDELKAVLRTGSVPIEGECIEED